MIQSNEKNIGGRSWGTFPPLSRLFLCVLIILWFLAGIGVTQVLGGEVSEQGQLLWEIGMGAVVLCLVLLFQWYEFAVVIILAIHLYVDWYLGYSVVALVIVFGLLGLFLLRNSSDYPWVQPRSLWLWVLFLVLTLYPTWLGSAVRYDVIFYYPNIIVGSLLFFWLGSVIARNCAAIRTLFQFLAGFGTLIAVHTVIQARTGITLLGTSSHEVFLADALNYQLSDVQRVGSFFVDPNWNGTFFAIMVFLPVGLLFTSSYALERITYCLEIFLMLFAVLLTYSNGAWIGIFAGVVMFVFIMGRMRMRIRYLLLLPLLIAIVAILLELFFPKQIGLQLQHATARGEFAARWSIWQTAWEIIKANPLSGIGFGHYNYLQASEIYRVPTQHISQDHPHNSYLEFAAMAGIPVLLLFVILLARALWQSLHNQAASDARMRSLVVAGMAGVGALTINSLTINGWTLPPLAAIGWLVLGCISSPLLSKQLASNTTPQDDVREQTA